jgi:hypothetical protein
MIYCTSNWKTSVHPLSIMLWHSSYKMHPVSRITPRITYHIQTSHRISTECPTWYSSHRIHPMRCSYCLLLGPGYTRDWLPAYSFVLRARARRDTTRQDCFVVIPTHTGVTIVYCSTVVPSCSSQMSVRWLMLSKGIPTHLITAIQTTYTESIINVNAGNEISEDSRVITQGVRQGCTLSPVLFNLYNKTCQVGHLPMLAPYLLNRRSPV